MMLIWLWLTVVGTMKFLLRLPRSKNYRALAKKGARKVLINGAARFNRQLTAQSRKPKLHLQRGGEAETRASRRQTQSILAAWGRESISGQPHRQQNSISRSVVMTDQQAKPRVNFKREALSPINEFFLPRIYLHPRLHLVQNGWAQGPGVHGSTNIG